MYKSKLVRKQLLLDEEDLIYIDQIISEKGEYTSLSQLVRELLKQQIQKKSKSKITKNSKLISLAGSIKPSNESDPEAANKHNDIYSI
jgi:Arc/MetJ-type ribon-helix-helix transcriptional regulator